MVQKKLSDYTRIISFILGIIVLAVSLTVWAMTEHSDIKDWTSNQDNATKVELKADAKEKYVPKHEFSAVKQELKSMKQDITRQLDRIEDKLSE